MLSIGILVLIALIIFGYSLSNKIYNFYELVLFWLLYIITVASVITIASFVYIYFVLKDIKGVKGERGDDGDKGEKGDEAICDELSCGKIIKDDLYFTKKHIGLVINKLYELHKGLKSKSKFKTKITSIKDKIHEKLLDSISSLNSLDIFNKEYDNIKKEENLNLTEDSNLNNDIENYYFSEKITSIIQSNSFNNLLLVEDIDKITLINYIKNILIYWILLIFIEDENYFNNVVADDTYFKDKKNNPFHEIKKFDIFYWGINKPEIESFENFESNSNRIKAIISNDYKKTYDNLDTNINPSFATYRPNKRIINNTKYCPVGEIIHLKDDKKKINTNVILDRYSGPPYNKKISNTQKKQISSPEEPTILVDCNHKNVKEPIYYEPIWYDWKTDQKYPNCRERYSKFKGVIYEPICPNGYTALGNIYKSQLNENELDNDNKDNFSGFLKNMGLQPKIYQQSSSSSKPSLLSSLQRPIKSSLQNSKERRTNEIKNIINKLINKSDINKEYMKEREFLLKLYNYYINNKNFSNEDINNNNTLSNELKEYYNLLKVDYIIELQNKLNEIKPKLNLGPFSINNNYHYNQFDKFFNYLKVIKAICPPLSNIPEYNDKFKPTFDESIKCIKNECLEEISSNKEPIVDTNNQISKTEQLNQFKIYKNKYQIGKTITNNNQNNINYKIKDKCLNVNFEKFNNNNLGWHFNNSINPEFQRNI